MKKINLNVFFNNKINLGHNNLKLKKSWHNNLNKYYIGTRNSTVIFNYKQTGIYLIKALHVLAVIAKSQGNVLVINTSPELSKLMYHVKKNVLNKNVFFSDCGWAKGMLTNWNKVFNKIKTFVDFYYDYNTFLNENNIHFPIYKKMKKNYKGFVDNNTHIHKNKPAIQRNFKNTSIELKNDISTHNNRLVSLDWRPDLLIFTGLINSESILKEAKALNIPTIAFVDSNSNVCDVIYKIPTNTNFYPIVCKFFSLATKILNSKYK